MPIFFRTYRKAPLASFVSIISSLFFYLAVIIGVGYVFNWENMRSGMQPLEAGLLTVVFLAVGFAFFKLAAFLAERKARKLAAKAGDAAGVSGTASAGRGTGASTAAAAKAHTACPRCGAPVDPGDLYCAECGAKLTT